MPGGSQDSSLIEGIPALTTKEAGAEQNGNTEHSEI
jgi:hypothetical protein